MAIGLNEKRSGEDSQHGESGVIDAVFEAIGIESHTCVEFGAYDLKTYSNVYHLWTNGWRALLIEGDPERCTKIRSDYRSHPQYEEQRVEIANRFVSEDGADSLDNILEEYDFPTDVDLVSIDVDGFDLHIWRGLERFAPRLVVIEYNATIPPHIEIVGGTKMGSSALALTRLGRQKGYSLIACTGWNAFFVQQVHAPLFADADDLEALFDYSCIRYAMQSQSGEIFFSEPLFLTHVPLFCNDTDTIENSSVPIMKTRNNRGLPGRVGNSAMRSFLRPLKDSYLRVLSAIFR